MEHQPPAGSQQPGGLGYPAGRVAPQAGAAFGDGQVEAARGQRDIGGVSLDERESDAEPALAAPGGLELGPGHVHPGRAGAAAGQPGGEVRRPAAELDGIQAADITKHAELCSGTLKMPQVMSAAAQASTACSPAYSLFARVHSSRFAATSSAPAPVSAIPHHHVSRRYTHATINGGIRQEHHAG